MPATGVVVGGWEFVWAAYGVSAAVLLGYAISVHLRYRAERERARREATSGGRP
jgi:heme exporter protein CcmD